MNDELRPINQGTIECDLRDFTRWLNDLKDQVNFLTKTVKNLQQTVEDHGYRINSLENRMDVAEQNIRNLSQAIQDLDVRVTALENSGQGGAIDMLAQRIDLLYSWLPLPYGMIPSKNWKFAMGNINVMSNQTAPTDTNGAGIYTSGSVEDNDITFN